MIGLAPADGSPKVQNVSLSPTNTVFSGAAVTLSVILALGANIGYEWQINSGSGFVTLPNSNTNSYVLDTTSVGQGSFQIQVVVTNGIGSNTSSPLALTVIPAIIQSVSISPPNNSSNNIVYAGTPVTLSSTVQGNGLTYYWQTDGGLGGGLANIPNSNTNVYVFDTSALSFRARINTTCFSSQTLPAR